MTAGGKKEKKIRRKERFLCPLRKTLKIRESCWVYGLEEVP